MNPQRPWKIYALADPQTEEIRYVGVTFRGTARLREHLSRARKGYKTHLYCWLRSLLAKRLLPVYSVLEEGKGEGFWPKAESLWIAKLGASGRLCNHTTGGEGTPGYVPTSEQRALWSKQRKGKKYSPGRMPAMLGKTHSADARCKISEAGKGKRRSKEAKARMSVAAKRRGVPRSTIEASAAARRGKKHTEEHKRKIAAATTGRKPVECVETRERFTSVKAAMRALGVPNGAINQAIRKGCRCQGNHYRFL